MSRLAQRFKALRERDERALVVFISAGDPSLDATDALVLAMAESGADVIEIGVPFSDPVGEGPTIQRSSQRGVASGATLRRILQRVRELRSKVDVPLVLMGYANPFFAVGAERFAAMASEAGVDGIIVPDLPPEEGAAFFRETAAHSIDNIYLVAPTTSAARMEMLATTTSGFLYYVSLTGVTGARGELGGRVEERVRRAKSFSDIPVCVGFGISKPEQAREVGAYADGVVVGSAIVDRIESARTPDEAVDTVGKFVAELKRALR